MNEIEEKQINYIPGVSELSELNSEKNYEFSGEDINLYVYELTDYMQEAIRNAGFSMDAEQALFLFMSEIANNAIKAKGSRVITDKYGSFEEALSQEGNAKEIINETIAKYYPDTRLKLKWRLEGDKLLVTLLNNNELNEYLEDRIRKALEKNPKITEKLLDEINSRNTVYDTNASGIGLGLSMAANYARIARGKLTFHGNTKGWTKFELELLK